MSHLPLPLPLFDKVLLKQRLTQGTRQQESLHEICAYSDQLLQERLNDLGRSFERTLVVGRGYCTAFTAADDEGWHSLIELLDNPSTLSTYEKAFDLIYCPLQLQWTESLRQTLTILRGFLKPGGLLLASILGQGSFTPLQELWVRTEEALYQGIGPRFIPLLTIHDVGNALQQAGFTFLVLDRDEIRLSYKDVWSIHQDMKALAWTNVLTQRLKQPLSRAFYCEFIKAYEPYRDSAGYLPLNLSIITLLGWQPEPLQLRPLRIGSPSYDLPSTPSRG